MNSKELYDKWRRLQEKSEEIYDEFMIEKNLNKKKKLEKQLDEHDLKETKIRKEYLKTFNEECEENSKLLEQNYNNDKYMVIYKDDSVEYFKHRKCIDYNNVKRIYEINKKEGYLSTQEIVYNNIGDHTKIEKFLNDNSINSVKEIKVYNNDILSERRVYRNKFRYEMYGKFKILEFELSSSYSIKYTYNYNDTVSIVKYIGSNYYDIDILEEKDYKQIRGIINKLRKDKHIKIDDILKEFKLDFD